MDVVTASFLVLGAVGAGGVVLHYAGYIPRPYRDRLESTQTALVSTLTDLPAHIGVEVENALQRVAAQQEVKYEAAVKGAETSLKMSGVRQVGVDKQQMKELKGLMVEGIGGPVFKAIEAWNPEWAERLREVDPDLLMRFIDSPWFQTNIRPRIQPFMDKFMGNTASMTSTETGWGQ